MSEEREINLSEKFPDMTPLRGAPSLGTINGVGVTLTGRRDFDAETGTYVKTRSICFLFIPLIPIDAFRVADAKGSGWYFIGKVPLSGFCKIWNLCILGLILAGIGAGYINSYYRSSEYVNGQLLDQARVLSGNGKTAEALGKYEAVASSGTSHAGAAKAEALELFQERIGQCDAAEAKSLFGFLAKRRNAPVHLVPDPAAAEAAAAAEARYKDQDPLAAFEIHRLARVFTPNPPDPDPEYEPLLEAARAAHPENLELAIEAAANFEKLGQLDKAKAALEPLAEKLGATEGARILGQLYAREEQHEKAFALLEPYAQQHLNALHAADDAYEKALQASNDRAINELNHKLVNDPWVKQYEKKDKAGQEQMVSEYVLQRMKVDSALHAVQQKLAQAASIVPVALDLGIVRLYRGREMKDPEAKKKELEAAEKVFLSIRNVAGESDAYRMYYAQVLYWLGKHEEGKKVFDELLASKNRDPRTLMGVGRTLRELGARNEATALFEEAYGKAANDEEKFQAAAFRHLSAEDADDSILWLERCDPKSYIVQAHLEAAKGNKALGEGDRPRAIQHLQACIQAWEKLPPSSTSLNERALAYSSIFYANGDPESFRQATKMLREAVALTSSDSILVLNAANNLVRTAILDLTASKLTFVHGGIGLNMELLSYFVRNQEERKALNKRLFAAQDFKDGINLYRKALLLAPRNEEAYGVLREVFSMQDDTEGLKQLIDALRNVHLDQAADNAKLLAYYAGSTDPKVVGDWKDSIAKRRKQLDEVRVDREQLTWVVTAVAYVHAHLAAHLFGQELDFDSLLAMALEAHKLAPSEATTGLLTAIHLQRAADRLAASNAAFKAFQDRYARALGTSYLFALALEQIEPLREQARQDPDVQAALTLQLATAKAYPDSPSTWMWTFFKHLSPADAEQAAERLRKDSTCLYAQQVRELLNPLSGAHALTGLWLRRVLGQEAEGLALYEAVRKRGVPLPDRP